MKKETFQTIDQIIAWLLEGDVSIQFQVHRDLLKSDRNILEDFQKRISKEGFGAKFLLKQNKNGHWGTSYYFPKWISTHYTLLDLKNLNIHPENEKIKKAVKLILKNEIGEDGGINPSVTIPFSDVCVTGMFLNYAAYFKTPEENLNPIIDYLLEQKMNDGGFNCSKHHLGAKKSSLHSTLSVAEGIREYVLNRYEYRLDELLEAEKTSIEFMLKHHLYLSCSTGEIIRKQFLRLSYPSRWFFDILRALDYLRTAEQPFDKRMSESFQVLIKKRKKNGLWPLQAHPSGQRHFDMEKVGSPSRWNTLRALRVFSHFKVSLNPE